MIGICICGHKDSEHENILTDSETIVSTCLKQFCNCNGFIFSRFKELSDLGELIMRQKTLITDKFLWGQIKQIVMTTGRFDYREWILEEMQLDPQWDYFDGEYKISWKLRLVPNKTQVFTNMFLTEKEMYENEH